MLLSLANSILFNGLWIGARSVCPSRLVGRKTGSRFDLIGIGKSEYISGQQAGFSPSPGSKKWGSEAKGREHSQGKPPPANRGGA